MWLGEGPDAELYVEWATFIDSKGRKTKYMFCIYVCMTSKKIHQKPMAEGDLRQKQSSWG